MTRGGTEEARNRRYRGVCKREQRRAFRKDHATRKIRSKGVPGR